MQLYGNHMIRYKNKKPARNFSSIVKSINFSLKSRSTTKITASLADVLQEPYLANHRIFHIWKYTTGKCFGYQKVESMILPDLNGLTFTKNWRIIYPHLDSKQQLWLWHPYMEVMHPLKSSTSSCPKHTSHKSCWNHTVKYCGLTTLEQVWGATLQKIMEKY